MGHQLASEIESADRIDVVMAFIRRSGIRQLLDALRTHGAAGRALRVLTTVYTGSTEAAALDELKSLGADVRVSYDDKTTRLHAKAWLFHRASGFSTAYIGSSNLTHSAQVTGLEWNVRLSTVRNPTVVERVASVFESYWNSGDFIPYDRDTFINYTEQQRHTSVELSPIEVRLEPFQESLLEQIALARENGHHKNLLVSATGTGKTVMAAVDFARLQFTLPHARLLFVAHRAEILKQSRRVFCHTVRDPSFGELWVDGERPARVEKVFASIQSLSAAGYKDLPPDHFDVVIVDEFHHAAADSYEALLAHLRPRELLGLTATPERSDGLPILKWFDDRIAAELRLWDAIDQHRLAPFHYFGIHDGLDLREVPWRRGRGYDVAGLSNLLTANDIWARFVVQTVRDYVDDPGKMRALGFCVSIEHAQYMARIFTTAGLAARAVWADSSAEDRRAALSDLRTGAVNVVFSVDLFNEGIDVPAVDTLLMLRPTDSATLFLQQLGRGLRRDHGKTFCTVLDFVGQHRREFRFDRRMRALLGGSRVELERAIEGGFPVLPAGCHMQLDAVAREIVLRNVREAVPAVWKAKVEELRGIGAEASLSDYLAGAGIELDDVYSTNRSWSDLREAAGFSVLAAGPSEVVYRRACGRLLHVDDRQRIDAYTALLSRADPPSSAQLSERERRYLGMIIGSTLPKDADKTMSLDEGCRQLWKHPQVRAEIVELLSVLRDRIAHVTVPLADAKVPLQVHARYSRIEILRAFGVGEGAKVATWQQGVLWVKDAQADLLAFTLDKSSGEFSPTTRYRDYAISRELIHWESQSSTRAASDVGRRYQTHVALGTSIMLFARLRSDDRAFWFLGPATYVRHEGELPMAITWRLAHALPGDLFATFAAAVA